MFHDINLAVETLVGEWGTPIMPFEHELFLYHFQTWIYFPKPTSVTRTAITLAAARFLEELGKKYVEVRGPRKLLQNGIVSLKKCLADDDYRSLYDEALKRKGGWTALLRQPSLADFDKQIQRRRTEADVVCDIIDYRFRYLEHGGKRKKEANIGHGQFYRWKKHGESGKTIRNRWSNNKDSAIFLYVNERLDPFMAPPEIDKDDFIQAISAQANDHKRTNAYFGICRYIAETLSGSDPNEQVIKIPSSVKSVRPITHPLSETELKWMENYSSESGKMRDS
ncbi:MAG: hypothetical protein ACXWBP_06775 [Limisphaerales bacterium]